MSTLPLTGATELVAAQANAEASVNEMGRHIEARASRALIEDRDLTAPPGTCSDGMRYLVKATATGAWAGKDGQLAIAVGTNASNGWLFQALGEGFRLYVRDEDVEILYNGSSWVTPTTPPQVQSVTSAATVTPTFSNDQVNITAQAVGLTLAAPTGIAVPAWGLVIRIKDNGTPQTITYNAIYRALGVSLPSTTVAGKTLYLGMIYNSTDTKWDVVSVAQEA